MKDHPAPPSFHSARQLRKKVESLPSPPKWQTMIIDIPGGTTKSKEQRRFYFRTAKDCLMFLMKDPMFDGDMELHPYTKYSKASDPNEKEQIVDNPMSGVYFNMIQVGRVFARNLSFLIPSFPVQAQ